MTDTNDTDNPSIAIVLGTRPEIIKLSPVIRACEHYDVSYSVIHTGQHYSDSLDSVFFDQLELPTPEHHLGVGSDTHATQTANMMTGLEEILRTEKPDVVLVQGDTNSVLAGAITVSKLEMELGHVEAGLRSFDREMPEETNRVMADHVADYLFAPTNTSRELLHDEGISDERIYVTGNTIVDAVQQNQTLAASKSSILAELNLEEQEFGLVTAHRAENVDTADRFQSLLRGAQKVGEKFDFELIYPIHPRAQERVEEFDIEVPHRIRLTDPLDYLDFLKAEREASIILTDSGGVQEEACILGTPCITMRDSTERPETIDVNANYLAGVSADAILEGVSHMLRSDTDWQNPFGDGTAGRQIVETVGRGESPDVA